MGSDWGLSLWCYTVHVNKLILNYSIYLVVSVWSWKQTIHHSEKEECFHNSYNSKPQKQIPMKTERETEREGCFTEQNCQLLKFYSIEGRWMKYDYGALVEW
jgi:hypothetical protein